MQGNLFFDTNIKLPCYPNILMVKYNHVNSKEQLKNNF